MDSEEEERKKLTEHFTKLIKNKITEITNRSQTEEEEEIKKKLIKSFIETEGKIIEINNDTVSIEYQTTVTNSNNNTNNIGQSKNTKKIEFLLNIKDLIQNLLKKDIQTQTDNIFESSNVKINKEIQTEENQNKKDQSNPNEKLQGQIEELQKEIARLKEKNKEEIKENDEGKVLTKNPNRFASSCNHDYYINPNYRSPFSFYHENFKGHPNFTNNSSGFFPYQPNPNEKLQKEIARLKEENEDFKGQIEELKEEIEELQKKNKEGNKQENDRLQKEIKENDRLKEEIEDLKGQIEELKEEIEELKKKNKEENKQENDRLQKEIKENDRLKEEIEDLKGQIDRLKGEIEELKKKNKEENDRLQKEIKVNEKLKEENDRLQKEIKVNEQLKEEIDRLQKENKEEIKENGELKKEIKVNEQLKGEIDRLQKEIDKLKRQINGNEDLKKKNEQEIEDLKGQIKVNEQLKEENKQEIEELQGQIEELQKEIARLKRQINGNEDLKEKNDRLQKENEQEIEELQKKNKQENDRLQKEIDKLKEKIKENEQLKGKNPERSFGEKPNTTNFSETKLKKNLNNTNNPPNIKKKANTKDDCNYYDSNDEEVKDINRGTMENNKKDNIRTNSTVPSHFVAKKKTITPQDYIKLNKDKLCNTKNNKTQHPRPHPRCHFDHCFKNDFIKNKTISKHPVKFFGTRDRGYDKGTCVSDIRNDPESQIKIFHAQTDQSVRLIRGVNSINSYWKFGNNEKKNIRPNTIYLSRSKRSILEKKDIRVKQSSRKNLKTSNVVKREQLTANIKQQKIIYQPKKVSNSYLKPTKSSMNKQRERNIQSVGNNTITSNGQVSENVSKLNFYQNIRPENSNSSNAFNKSNNQEKKSYLKYLNRRPCAPFIKERNVKSPNTKVFNTYIDALEERNKLKKIYGISRY